MSATAQISFQLYRWLSSLQIITSSLKNKSNGNIQVDSKLEDQFISGQLIAKLLQTISLEQNVNLNGPLLSSIKKSNTPASRVYNWNILSQSFTKLGISMTKHMQKQITSGNFQQLNRFLLQIYRKTKVRMHQNQKNQKPIPSQKQNTQDQLDFNRIDKYQTYDQCETVLQVIVKMINKTCGLTSKQAFSTLAQNLKYFSHMIVKGIKNSYQQIQNFFACMIQNMPHLMYLSERDPATNTSFLLQLVKPTLISRQPSVALIGSQTLKAIIYESLKYNSKNIIYQILTTQPSGFDFIYMGIKRHPHLSSQYIIFIHKLIDNTYMEFFQVYLKNLISNDAEYIRTIIILLDGIKLLDESKKNVVQSGLLKRWVKMCEEFFQSPKDKKQIVVQASHEQAKILSLQLMGDLWKTFSSQLDEAQAEQLLMKGIQQLKKNTRKDNYLVKITALNRLFDFLDYLANQKNRLASIVYKKTIFLLFQNHEDNEIRQVILQNFSLILRKFPTIPLEFLLEPLLKQLMKQEGQSYILNVYDFEFFIQIFKHPKIESSWALNFLQYFTKLYTKNIIYSGLVIRVIELLASRFCEQEAIGEYIIKNVESSLNVYGILAIGKKTYSKGRQERLMNSQKKSLIIELIKFYIKLQNQLVNESIKQKILSLYTTWMDMKNHNDKGLYHLLTLFGDVQQMTMKERIEKQSHRNQAYSNLQSKQSKQYSRNTPQVDKTYQSNIYSPIDYKLSQSNKSRVKSTKVNQNSRQFLAYNSYMEDKQFNLQNQISQFSAPKQNQYKKLVPRQSRSSAMDKKTMDDIEFYKKKYHIQSQRRKQLQDKDKQFKVAQVNEKQLIQRNVALGYNKFLKTDQLFYQYETVKTKYLKEQTQFIDIEKQQDRDIKSVNLVFKRYEKYIQSLFYKYTALGNILNRSPTQDKVFLSFSDLNKMLKEKNVSKLPKIVINQIVTYINRKKKYNINVLVGIEENQFNQFLLIFTNLYFKDEKNSKDQPFGFKIQKMLMRLFEGEIFFKQLTDKKAQQWFVTNKIQTIPSQKQEYVPIPQGYKRVVNQQPILIYQLKSNQETNLPESYHVCLELLNFMIKKCINVNILVPMTQSKQITRLVPLLKVPKAKIPQVLTEKVLKKKSVQMSMEQLPKKPSEKVLNQGGSKKLVQKPKSSAKRDQLFKISNVTRAKSHKDLINKKINKTQIMNDEILKKHKVQEEKAKKLREQLDVLRKQKQKKSEQEKVKKQLEEKQKLKKQQKHKKYIEQNKKKIQQKKQKQQQQKKHQQIKQQQQKQLKKKQLKQKQTILLQKQQKQLQQKKQKFQSKQKSQQKKIKKIELLEKKSKNTVQQNIKNQQMNAEKQKQKRLIDQINDTNSQIIRILQPYQKQIKLLFEQYWNWKTHKIQLKEVALMMKNFKVSPQYLPPKVISEAFKVLAKGDSLSYEQFKQLLIRYSFKSQKLAEQIKSNSGKQFEPQLLKCLLSDKLQMKAHNYQQKLKQAKMQQI